MTGFVASPIPPVTQDGTMLEAGPFWPPIDVNRFRNAMRIGGQSIPDARVREALIGAIITVDDNLSDWALLQRSAGRETLVDIPALSIDGESRLALLWRRAVHAFATADLIETHRDVSATKDGAARADDDDLTPADHRRNGIHAIRDMTGERRTAVELI